MEKSFGIVNFEYSLSSSPNALAAYEEHLSPRHNSVTDASPGAGPSLCECVNILLTLLCWA